MKIGLDGNEANNRFRVGSGVYALELLKQFSRNKKHNFTVYLKEKPLRDMPEENHNFKYKIFGPKKLWTQFALPVKLIIGENFDIFFSMSHYGPRFSKIPYVVTIFDLSYLHYPELFNKDDLYQLKNWSKYSINNSKHIITISNSTKEDIIKNYNINVSKISVTYLGYDQQFKDSNEVGIEEIKEKYNIKNSYIIFVGTLQPRKNIKRLIEAFRILLDKGINWQLVITGKNGWMYKDLFEQVQKLKLENNIIFTDFVPENELSLLLRGAGVYILPSLYEGFGIPVIEAQASGVPVIVSNTSSLPEIVGDSAIFIEPTSTDSIVQALYKMIKSEKLRKSYIKLGFENIKRFSWVKCADQTLEILQKVAKK